MPEHQKSGNLAINLIFPIAYAEWISSTMPPDGPSWQGPRLSCQHQAARRVLDICGALCGLLVLALLLPVIALLIWFEDAGPIFYKQVRVGQHGQAFFLYKLRTMIVDADGYLGRHPELLATWHKNGKLHDDPRITRLGRFLRRTSLDELPQMWNILRGDMSLVGPRAIQFSEIEAFRELIELRQQVKPGLTGLWQVSGRSTTSYEQRIILDCTYIMECSIWMDIAILWKTPPSVFGRVGAY